MGLLPDLPHGSDRAQGVGDVGDGDQPGAVARVPAVLVEQDLAAVVDRDHAQESTSLGCGAPPRHDVGAGSGGEEVGDRVACALVGIGRPRRQLVGGAVGVRVLVLVEVGEPVDHGLGLLGSGSVVEPHEGPEQQHRGLALSTGTLFDGIKGTPRRQMNCEPNRLTVAGGTPRRVHWRPNAAMASMPYSALVISSPSWRSLYRLDGEAALLFDLVVGVAVEVRHPRADVQHGGHGAQDVLAGSVFVVDERLRQLGLVPGWEGDVDRLGVPDLVQPVDARLGQTRLVRSGL